MNAYQELIEYLEDGETIDGSVFGVWGGGSGTDENDTWESEYEESILPLVPFSDSGKVLTIE